MIQTRTRDDAKFRRCCVVRYQGETLLFDTGITCDSTTTLSLLQIHGIEPSRNVQVRLSRKEDLTDDYFQGARSSNRLKRYLELVVEYHEQQIPCPFVG